MRQGQQNRRGRGRNNNHQQHNNRRGGQNPLTRSFESTGPDTKIRGTPAHIAEKYMTLARDAQTSGDPVLAENYLQHAEHYNRIIMTYREQTQQNGGELNGGPQPGIARYRPGPQDPLSGDDGDGDGEGDEGSADPGRKNEPQPAMGDRDAPRDNPRSDDRPQRQDNQPYRQQNRDRQDNRNFSGERRDRPDRFERQDRAPRGEPEGEGQRRAPRPAAAPVHEQPEFLRRPVRRPRRDDTEERPESAAVPAADEPTRE